ncbi:aminodeoxychorismate synthase component I [Naasia lichenicola]|uniref:aminodeoxychorismate synthase n=2 Tax=Naasia lichenicola TaxID=2565933 RepID=A0A4S4FJG1_9MICO|nr:aminodeoxychorismate synthase component I [Naasia lichenicola]
MLAEIQGIAASSRTSVELGGWLEPEVVFLALMRDQPHAAWLDAGVQATSGWSHLCQLGPAGYALIGSPTSVSVQHPSSARAAVFAGSILDALDEVEMGVGSGTSSPGAQATASERFELGWVGWLGYESGAAAVDVQRALSASEDAAPDSAMLFVDRLIAFDHVERRVILTTFAETDGALEWLDRTERDLLELRDRATDVESAQPPRAAVDDLPRVDLPRVDPVAVGTLRHAPDAYRSMILACQESIVAGDAYQLCLTNQITVPVHADPVAVYRRLRWINPTPRGGLIVAGDLALASSSPELFLRIAPDGSLETRPIKGTRPRGADPAADGLLRRELFESEKERAENLMIVDLMRNDFTRVAELGSVRVPSLFAVEQYANVFQLVSTVTAQLAPGSTPLAAIRSAFPAGSMTGAPKVRAMSILAELEGGPRGPYAGAFGFLGIDGRVELSMTIRTVVLDRLGGTATIGTGGGITALSQPDEEIAEMILKAQPVLAALGARLETELPAPDHPQDGTAIPREERP